MKKWHAYLKMRRSFQVFLYFRLSCVLPVSLFHPRKKNETQGEIRSETSTTWEYHRTVVIIIIFFCAILMHPHKIFLSLFFSISHAKVTLQKNSGGENTFCSLFASVTREEEKKKRGKVSETERKKKILQKQETKNILLSAHRLFSLSLSVSLYLILTTHTHTQKMMLLYSLLFSFSFRRSPFSRNEEWRTSHV